MAVARTAEGIAHRLQFNADVLAPAAWLHDIGYAPEVVDSGFYPLDGARYLRGLGYPLEVVRLVAHHSGALIEADERGLQDQLLAEFPFEPSGLMDALWYSDMTTGPQGEPLAVEERLAEIRERYGARDVVTRFVERAEPELIGAVRRVEQLLASPQSR